MRIERQLGIIGKAATDNEIEDMIEKSKNGESVPIFTGVSFLCFAFLLIPPWGSALLFFGAKVQMSARIKFRHGQGSALLINYRSQVKLSLH